MRNKEQLRASAAIGLCLLGLSLLWSGRTGSAPPAGHHLEPTIALKASGSGCAALLHEASAWRTRAHRKVRQEFEAVETWDPQAAISLNWHEWYRLRLAADGEGCLKQAWLAAVQAATLARTPEDQCRSVELLRLLACEAGRHAEELRYARQLTTLRPGELRSHSVLRAALACNRSQRRIAEVHRDHARPAASESDGG